MVEHRAHVPLSSMTHTAAVGGAGPAHDGDAVLSMPPAAAPHAAHPAAPHPAARTCGSIGPRLPEYFRRMVHCNQMDFDSALAQMAQLCVDPGRAFHAAKHRKLTKNHWARDDPAFVLLLAGFVAAASVAYSVALHLPLGLGLGAMVKLVLWDVGVSFLGAGVVAATALWFFANRYLHGRGQLHEWRPAEPLEWLYAFDVHCGAFVPVFMLCYVLQFFLLPWLLKASFFARLLSNTLYAFALCCYFYVTFRGYLELPFLERQEYFLYPIFFIGVAFVLSVITPFSATTWAISWQLAVA